MLLSDIETKSVVNVVDGAELGYVVDLELDPVTGQILQIMVKEYRGFWCWLKREDPIVIEWNQIIKIGDDVVIVNNPELCEIKK